MKTFANLNKSCHSDQARLRARGGIPYYVRRTHIIQEIASAFGSDFYHHFSVLSFKF